MLNATPFYAVLYAFFAVLIVIRMEMCYVLLMNTFINTFQKKSKKQKADLARLHFHNGYELIFVTNGAVTYEIDSTQSKVKAPAIILLNPFEQHKITEESENYERTVLVLNADLLEQNLSPRLTAMLKCRPVGFSHTVKPKDDVFRSMQVILGSIENEIGQDNLFCQQYILNCVYNLLILMYRAQESNTRFSPRMAEIQAFIDANYAEIDGVQSVAQEFCLSASHFSRVFKEYSGYSPVEYLKNIRLYHAQQLLLHSDYSVNEISLKVGFRETNNFIKQFKNQFNITPAQFRKDKEKYI